MSASNIIVNDNLEHHIIDWQGTTVAPLFMQTRIPRAVIYSDTVIQIPDDYSMPAWPTDLDELPLDEQEVVRLHHTLASRHQYYLKCLGEIDRRFSASWELPYWGVAVWLISHIINIEASPLNLRHDLVSLQRAWEEISPAPCPIHFTEEELAKHDIEYADYQFYSGRVRQLHGFLGCDSNGWVKNDDFERVRGRMEEMKEVWDSEKEKGPYPFEEESHYARYSIHK